MVYIIQKLDIEGNGGMFYVYTHIDGEIEQLSIGFDTFKECKKYYDNALTWALQ